MRIYAPDAPYDDDTVKVGRLPRSTRSRPEFTHLPPSPSAQEICSLFVAQLQGLRDTVNQSYAQYFYLLERLAMVRLLPPPASRPPAHPTGGRRCGTAAAGVAMRCRRPVMPRRC